MSDIKIICDSLSDVTDDMLEKYDIDMMPLTIIINGEEYKERVDIYPEDLYKRMREEKVIPTTSQVTYGAFEQIFKKYLDQGKKILYIAASSTATGNYQSAILAKNNLGGDIHIVDSQQFSYGIGRLVVKAAELSQEGKSIEEIVEYVENHKDEQLVIFCVDSLEYLKKGGRISGTKAILGTMLNIKPILYKNEEGLVAQLDQARGRKNVALKLIEHIKKNIKSDISELTVHVGVSDNLKENQLAIDMVLEEIKPKEVKYFTVGAAIGTHSGPGIYGFFIEK